MPRPLPSKSFLIHDSTIILPFDTISCNNPLKNLIINQFKVAYNKSVKDEYKFFLLILLALDDFPQIVVINLKKC
jgi:hypothetical protein